MPMIKRILCPTDFSSTSTKAFHYADRLARLLGSELIVVVAYDILERTGISGREHPADPTLDKAAGETLPEIRPADPHVREQLDAIRRSSPELPLERVLHPGSAGDVICWLAQDRQCDLIVIGAHGRSGLTHLLFGSVTEYVMRHAPCPVLAVREHPETQPPMREPNVTPVRAPRFM